MLFKTFSAAVYGIDAYLVEVEGDVSAGMGIFTTVGLPDAAVRESRERIKSAIKNCGPAVRYRELREDSGGETSDQIRGRVVRAREKQLDRY